MVKAWAMGRLLALSALSTARWVPSLHNSATTNHYADDGIISVFLEMINSSSSRYLVGCSAYYQRVWYSQLPLREKWTREHQLKNSLKNIYICMFSYFIWYLYVRRRAWSKQSSFSHDMGIQQAVAWTHSVFTYYPFIWWHRITPTTVDDGLHLFYLS